MAYNPMPIKEVKVADLVLDVDNYRFPIKQLSESAAMNYLFAEHDVPKVASLILRDGYVDNEIPMVTPDSERYVILEGNRRLSALRALLDPSLVPAHQAEIERLLKRFSIEAADLPEVIRVMVFPDRDSAAPVLARLHTGDAKKGWSLDEQAKFVFAQLTDGMTVGDLKNQLPGIKEPVRLIRMGRMRELLMTTKFAEQAIGEYASSPRLKMSSFEYAYRNSDIQSAIGIAFDDQGNLVSRPSTPSHLVALERLLQGFKAGKLNTRRGLKPETEEFESLLAELRAPLASVVSGDQDDAFVVPEGRSGRSEAEVPEGRSGRSEAEVPEGRSGRSEAEVPEGRSGRSEAEAAKQQPDRDNRQETADTEQPIVDPRHIDSESRNQLPAFPSRGPNNPETKATLDFSGFDEESLPVPLKHRVRELRRIRVYDFPAAAAMLMRSVLEAAIKEHYGIKYGPEVSGTLGKVMEKVTSDYASNGTLSHAISTINHTKKGASTKPGTGEWFNLVAHSVNIDADGTQVHQAWRVVLPLVRFLLQPSAKGPTL
ncbi:hypothetical protein RE9416_45610 [Prescottella equi]|uniref:hypothetical protein n=1 Tax=Prescottella sp. D32 TaxID=3029740 RepID=UPI001C79770E|nr:hypothetical protein RE9416_45610 [Prescottella equi]